MSSIRPAHYIILVAVAWLYCTTVIQFAFAIVPALMLTFALLLTFPVLAPFMIYQQKIYPTPQPSDFPILILIYLVYFLILFSPVLLMAVKNQRK